MFNIKIAAHLFIIIFFYFSQTSQAQKYAAELISQKTNIVVNKESLVKDLYYEILINSRAGEEFTKITLPYSKLDRISKIEAYVKDSNGRIIKQLRNSDIIEKSSISDFSFYEDNYVKEFTLRHNEYPYTIVISYQMKQNEFLYIDRWIPVIDQNLPTQNASLEVSVPVDYKIVYNNQFVDEPLIDTIESQIKYRWETNYKEIIKPEAFSPPILTYIPRVEVVPIEFYFDINGSFKDWVLFGNWQYELLSGLNELPDYEKSRIQAQISTIENTKEKIKKLYHYLQDETRYINVTIETGGLKPYSASYVANNKFGDCKALTNYFKSILDYLSIPSYYTKVHAGSPVSEIDKDFTSQQFNHIILFIPLKEEEIWLDCTSDGAFNYLGAFTQNRDALVISKDNSRFVRTPSLKPFEVLESRKIETSFNSDKTRVSFDNTYKGDSYETLLQIEKNYNDSEKIKLLNKYFIGDGLQLVDFQIFNSDRDSAKIKLAYKAETHNVYRQYGDEILISNIAFPLPLFEPPQVRKLPIQIDYPIHLKDTIQYEIPGGYKLNKTAISYSVTNKFGEYSTETFENAGKVTTIKSLLINAANYSISEYNQFYDFYKQIIESENRVIISLSKY